MRTEPPFTHGEVEQLMVALTIIRDMASIECSIADPWKRSEYHEVTLREIHRRAAELVGDQEPPRWYEMEPSGRKGGG